MMLYEAVSCRTIQSQRQAKNLGMSSPIGHSAEATDRNLVSPQPESSALCQLAARPRRVKPQLSSKLASRCISSLHYYQMAT